ncbi:MAG: TetR/AcrR family transcriptional regulator [Micrococcaceae bacterium]|nr:TetR/AcrR family transcriptional regulator [Micrococcaceae bacterium]
MADRKQDVFDAAAQLFQTNGINATTIEDITKAAGIAKGAFYKHFDSKDQLILELVQHFYDDVLATAARQVTAHPDSPLDTLRNTIAAELEVATDYQNFLHAVALDFPPNSSGPVPDTIETLQHQLYVWHKHILLDAFGTRIDPYLEDLVIVLEGTISHYLMRIFWRGAAPPGNRIAGFITQSLHAIVTGDEDLTPAFSSDWQDKPNDDAPLESMAGELTVVRATMQRRTECAPTFSDDLAAIDLVLEELQDHPPRQFLVDALLAQLSVREYLTDSLQSTRTSWNNWKGTPQ